ncbi:MAG: BMP family ABC transporter substrate-binding protein [Oscillospiraceae bacterium]
MKKRFLATLFAGVLAVSLFASCGAPAAASSSAAAASAGSAASTSVGTDGEPLKVALLLTGNLGDMSFLDSSNEGMKQVAEKYGAEVKVIEMGADATKYETNLLDASEGDYDVIIGSGWQTQEPIQNVAPDFPDKKYIIFDASVDYTTGDLSNVYSISYKQNEASFLAGVMAASMSETGVLGFLGGMDGPVINDFLIGYIEGGQYVNPDIKFLVGYVGSYVDSAKCKEMSLSQYNQGNADFVFTAAGAAGLGTLDAAKETGKWAIGVDSDQALLFAESDPDKANLIPASVMKRVDNSLVRAFDMIAEGTLPWGQAEELGLADSAVGLSENEYYEKLVPQDVRDAIDAAEAKIISGEITVTTAFGMETSAITAVIDSVKP